MVTENAAAEQLPPGISRFTRSIGRCLGQTDEATAEPDRSLVQALINLVQGRILEYLADRICRAYDISEPHARERIQRALLHIFSDEFFAVFRAKIERRPGLVLMIARRIVRCDLKCTPRDGATAPPASPDRLYSAIFRKYFEYRNLNALLQMVESDAEIQKIVLPELLQRRVDEPNLYHDVLDILEHDEQGVCPNLFMAYVEAGQMDELLALIRSGRWKEELAQWEQRIAALQGN